MDFDPDNEVVKLCAQGMMTEGEGKLDEAHELFMQAWGIASNDFEHFTAAHYVARNQQQLQDKLHWNVVSLQYALKIDDEVIASYFPSLYLNFGKSYEDLGENELALKNYIYAKEASHYLAVDGYGNMINAGIEAGIKRNS
ncbi:hypothetical protein [Mucilaginibacter dorajii]|uniref:rRNA adenine methyltransferase n=1 Tax=Mucilaginibacter dorajii TaxID=692994 RepID=A0ABP7PD84_9SPHI|nr:hypothetical protein [Mucilaginibacter dorajii]MCS3734700.1 rifampin ADP-ribosylating transferase [Mucilaginibacter dorajii]